MLSSIFLNLKRCHCRARQHRLAFLQPCVCWYPPSSSTYALAVHNRRTYSDSGIASEALGGVPVPEHPTQPASLKIQTVQLSALKIARQCVVKCEIMILFAYQREMWRLNHRHNCTRRSGARRVIWLARVRSRSAPRLPPDEIPCQRSSVFVDDHENTSAKNAGRRWVKYKNFVM